MARKRERAVDPALVPFLDALAEILVARLLQNKQREAGAPAEVIELPASDRRNRTARKKS